MARTSMSNIVQQMENGIFFIYETPIGLINGVNDDFTLTYPPDPTNSLMVILNGQVLSETEDYTLIVDILTLNTAPPTGSLLKVEYHVESD
jgi:hypothetical protein